MLDRLTAAPRSLLRRLRPRRWSLAVVSLFGVLGAAIGVVLARRRRQTEDWTTDWMRTSREALDGGTPSPEDRRTPSVETGTATAGPSEPGGLPPDVEEIDEEPSVPVSGDADAGVTADVQVVRNPASQPARSTSAPTLAVPVLVVPDGMPEPEPGPEDLGSEPEPQPRSQRGAEPGPDPDAAATGAADPGAAAAPSLSASPARYAPPEPSAALTAEARPEPPEWVADRTRQPAAPAEAPSGVSRLGIVVLAGIVIVSLALLYYYWTLPR